MPQFFVRIRVDDPNKEDPPVYHEKIVIAENHGMVEKKILTLSLSAASMIHSEFASAPPKIQSAMKLVADKMFGGDLEKLKAYFAAKQIENTHIEQIREICN